MRTKNSIINITIGLISQIIIVLLGFLSRKVFINSLGVEYLGINGLLTNVLSMLSLVEWGIGSTMLFSLYKPLAEKDTCKIAALMQVYKKIYRYLAILVLLMSTVLYPFINIFIKDVENVPYIGVVYSIFVMQNLISYLFTYKFSLMNADQKGYILNSINTVFYILVTIIKIFILMRYSNYILFLSIDIVTTLIRNMISSVIIDKRYSFLKDMKSCELDSETKVDLIQRFKSVMLHKIGAYCVFATDNLLISALVNVKTVGIYSNYTMIIQQLEALIQSVFTGINASVGNMIAVESQDKSYSVFKVMFLINFYIYSIATIFLYNLIEPFIGWWLGPGLTIGGMTFNIVILNFFINGMRTSINITKTTAGLVNEDRYVPLIEAGINLSASIALASKWGLIGIFLGTTISTLTTAFWNQPRLVYKHIFNKPVREYFIRYIKYSGIMIITFIISRYLCNTVEVKMILLALVLKGLICLIVPSIIYGVCFYRCDEGQYLFNIGKKILNKRKAMESIRG